jgi:transcription elongation factor GreA
MTNYGYEKLSAELSNLKNVQKPAIVQEVDIARSHGDLKENAEYHAARDKQAFIEGRISQLSDLISRAQIIDPSTLAHDVVSFGSTVELVADDDTELSYTILGSTESNPDIGIISFYSPLAKELIGKEEGDEITINLPTGKKTFEIDDIYYKKIEQN